MPLTSLDRFSLGWRGVDEEDQAILSTPSPVRAMLPRITDFQAPKSIDHRSWRKAKDQDGVGACTGFGGGSGVEVCLYNDSLGKMIQRFSENYIYRNAQLKSGISGDNGATISGVVQALTDSNIGACYYDFFPFRNQYEQRIPEEAQQEGKKTPILSWHRPESYDECFQWIASRAGVVIIGVPWTESLVRCNGVIEEISGRTYGGHCNVLHGYTERKDRQGRNYLIDENSHTEQWGNRGFAETAPSVIEHWIEDRQSEVLVFTDIKDPEDLKKRIFEWEKSDWMA